MLPDVPTMAEAGVTGTDMEASWHGLFAPVKTACARSRGSKPKCARRSRCPR